MDTQTVALLCVEAVGAFRLQAVAEAGDRCQAGLEYGQVGSRTLASEQKSGVELRNACSVLCGFGFTIFSGW